MRVKIAQLEAWPGTDCSRAAGVGGGSVGGRLAVLGTAQVLRAGGV